MDDYLDKIARRAANQAISKKKRDEIMARFDAEIKERIDEIEVY